MSDEPTRRQIVVEIVWFAAIVVLVGAIFVALRFAREGPRILTYDLNLHPPR